MAWKLELAEQALRDLGLIFDHLTDSYRAFGESPAEAADHAKARIRAIRLGAERLASTLQHGTRRDHILPGLRHLTLDIAIYWSDVDKAAGCVRVLAVFFGGQNHVRHMLRRLLEPPPG